MKKITIIVLSALILSACSDFLNIKPEGTSSSTGLDYTKAENIFKPVSAAYASMRSYGSHDMPYIAAFEITSDNADKGSTAEDGPETLAMDNFTVNSTNSLVNSLWVGYYDIVSAANNALFQLKNFYEALSSEENKNYVLQCEGEAKFIRAYAYFNLVRLFANVPIIDKTMTADELADVKPSAPAAIYDFIETDLEEAIAVLPESYSKAFAGRITSFTAHALKAKVHLYQAEYPKVAEHAGKVMESGRYSLLSDFRQVFSIDGENSAESLFEIQCSDLGMSTGTNVPYFEYAYHQGPRGGKNASNMQGWGFCVPSEDLMKFFEDRGEVVRPATTLLRAGTITPEGDYIDTGDGCPLVYNGKVYTPSAYNEWSYNGYGFDHNVRILRYADVLLMYAEAVARGASEYPQAGMTAQAAFDWVRDRAGLAPTALTPDSVIDERRAELAMEEDRFFDLVRTGKAASVLKGFKSGKNEVFPIPAQQLQLNLNLKQNNGY